MLNLMSFIGQQKTLLINLIETPNPLHKIKMGSTLLLNLISLKTTMNQWACLYHSQNNITMSLGILILNLVYIWFIDTISWYLKYHKN